jgi:hypothetical protein
VLPPPTDCVQAVDLADEAGGHCLHVPRLVCKAVSDDLERERGKRASARARGAHEQGDG